MIRRHMSRWPSWSKAPVSGTQSAHVQLALYACMKESQQLSDTQSDR